MQQPSTNAADWKEPGVGMAVGVLAALTLAFLLLFVNKAVHIDDPLFVWTARHVQAHPLDFYGFTVDWGRSPTRMCDEMKNPPLAAYYLAAVGSLFGWSERTLHFGSFLPAVALVVGTYFLARRFCRHPLAAGLATLAAPVFLLCATSLMCDTLMMALWVWAAYFWMDGLESGSGARLALAAVLIAACSLAKYYGACLIPLLGFYTVLRVGRAGSWMCYLCLPVLALAGYQYLTYKLYGEGLLGSAALYAAGSGWGADWERNSLKVSSLWAAVCWRRWRRPLCFGEKPGGWPCWPAWRRPGCSSSPGAPSAGRKSPATAPSNG